MTTSPPEWRRLADLLVQRRIQLGYRQRKDFAEASGLRHDRLLFDLENAKRTNFEAGTLAKFEQLYQWAPGSISAVLNGADPTPIDRGSYSGQARHIEDFSNDELLFELGRRIKMTDQRLVTLLTDLSGASLQNTSEHTIKNVTLDTASGVVHGEVEDADAETDRSNKGSGPGILPRPQLET